MTLYQFNNLDEMKQIETVWNRGVLLDERKDGEDKYSLYKINSFYVELKNAADGMGYDGIKTFATTVLLEPYFGQIKIPGYSY